MTENVEITVRVLAEDEWSDFGPRIAAIEGAIEYPLGDDGFRIDHGSDYFAFFRRLGRLCYVVALRDGQILGVLAAVERQLPTLGSEPVWYLGDLKVVSGGRGSALTSRLLRALVDERGPRRGYGISMNPGDGAGNRVIKLLRRLPVDCEFGTDLNFYSLDASRMDLALPLLRDHRGPVSFVSLRGVKDIVLRSSGRPMSLLHAQFGSCAQGGIVAPQDEYTHMFCAPSGDALCMSLTRCAIDPMATATVVHSGLPSVDWSFVLTSDI